MGLGWIVKCVEALQQAGIRAQRGFPVGKMPYLTGPVAGVSVEQAQEDAVTVAVRVYAPVNQGGAVCEDTAALAVDALAQLGAQCRMGSCEFDGKAGLFCLPVQAVFAQTVFESEAQVLVNGVSVSNLLRVSTSFRCTLMQYTDTETEVPYLASAYKRWSVQLEDLLPAEALPQEVADGFSLVIRRSSGTQTYSECCWESVTTEKTDCGIKRLRVASTCNQPVTAETE